VSTPSASSLEFDNIKGISENTGMVNLPKEVEKNNDAVRGRRNGGV